MTRSPAKTRLPPPDPALVDFVRRIAVDAARAQHAASREPGPTQEDHSEASPAGKTRRYLRKVLD